MLIFLLTLTKKVSILTSFSLLKKVSALSSKLTKKVSFEVRGVHSPQLGQYSGCLLEPHSTDSLGHQHSTKKLSPKIALHFKVLCESKATLPYIHDNLVLHNRAARYNSNYGSVALLSHNTLK